MRLERWIFLSQLSLNQFTAWTNVYERRYFLEWERVYTHFFATGEWYPAGVFTFLDLPPELRNMVMELIVADDKDVVDVEPPFFSSFFSCDFKGRNLLLTCKQIYLEGRNYYGRLRIRLPILARHGQLLPDYLPSFYPFGRVLRPYLRHVLLDIPIVQKHLRCSPHHGRLALDSTINSRLRRPDADIYFLLPHYPPRSLPPVAGAPYHGDLYATSQVHFVNLMRDPSFSWRRYAVHRTKTFLFMEHDMRHYLHGLSNRDGHVLTSLTLNLQNIDKWMFKRNFLCNNMPDEFREGVAHCRLLPFAALFVAICCERPTARRIVFTGLSERVRGYLILIWTAWREELLIQRSPPLSRATVNRWEWRDEISLLETFRIMVQLWHSNYMVRRRAIKTQILGGSMRVEENYHLEFDPQEVTPTGERIWRESAEVLDGLRPGWTWEEVVDEVMLNYEWEFKE